MAQKPHNHYQYYQLKRINNKSSELLFLCLHKFRAWIYKWIGQSSVRKIFSRIYSVQRYTFQLPVRYLMFSDAWQFAGVHVCYFRRRRTADEFVSWKYAPSSHVDKMQQLHISAVIRELPGKFCSFIFCKHKYKYKVNIQDIILLKATNKVIDISVYVARMAHWVRI